MTGIRIPLSFTWISTFSKPSLSFKTFPIRSIPHQNHSLLTSSQLLPLAYSSSLSTSDRKSASYSTIQTIPNLKLQSTSFSHQPVNTTSTSTSTTTSTTSTTSYSFNREKNHSGHNPGLWLNIGSLTGLGLALWSYQSKIECYGDRGSNLTFSFLPSFLPSILPSFFLSFFFFGINS